MALRVAVKVLAVVVAELGLIPHLILVVRILHGLLIITVMVKNVSIAGDTRVIFMTDALHVMFRIIEYIFFPNTNHIFISEKQSEVKRRNKVF